MHCSPRSFRPGKRGRTHFWERLSLSQRAAPHNDRQTASARRWLVASSAGTTAAACAGSRRRHPGLARSWPGRTRVRVAYLKLELSVLLKSAKTCDRAPGSLRFLPGFLTGDFKHPYRGLRGEAHSGVPREAPQVFVPALAAWPAPQPRPAPPAMLPVAPRPTLN